MRIAEETITQGTIEEFANAHDLTMNIRERRRPLGDQSRFYASFDRCDVKGDGVLIGSCGNGATPEAAIANYAEAISMKRLVWNAHGEDRREIDVWRLCR